MATSGALDFGTTEGFRGRHYTLERGRKELYVEFRKRFEDTKTRERPN
jgi:hypothetical protein